MSILEQERFQNIQEKTEPAILTGIDVFDKWFSNKGGMVIGSAIFLTGTSGAGKTTLMAFLAKILSNISYSLYSREMPKHALKEQVERLNIKNENFFISDQSTRPNFASYLDAIDEIKPKIVVVDSIQVIAKEDFPDMSEQEAIYKIIRDLRTWTDKNNAVLIIIGHVTKKGGFRGDNTIMQMFDAHMEMIFDKKKNIRTISWGAKNRKGVLGGPPLYYEFSDSNIEIFSEDEWNFRVNKVSLSEFVQKSIVGYLNAINKNNPNYNAFYAELNLNMNKVYELENDEIQLTIEFFKLIQTLLKKYQIN